MKTRQIIITGLCCSLILATQASSAGWRDWLQLGSEEDKAPASSTQSDAGSSLSNTDVIGGLKEALQNATQYAVSNLGAENGFLNNPRVKIPMPGALGKVEKTLRSLGASRYADEFVETMNHAAEKAVVKATPLFTKAVSEMTIEDGMKILKGGDNAATEYFRSKTATDLTQSMLPITQEMTNNSGVTSSYKKMIDKLGFARGLVGDKDIDLDQYVTDKAVDGLFVMVAEQEKKIRKDPVAQTTSLLKKVFGSL